MDFLDSADYEEWLSMLYSQEPPNDSERLPQTDDEPLVEHAEIPF